MKVSARAGQTKQNLAAIATQQALAQLLDGPRLVATRLHRRDQFNFRRSFPPGGYRGQVQAGD